MDKLDQAFFRMIVDAGWYIKPVALNYFRSSVSHSTDIWKDYHEKKLGGYILGIKDVGSK